MGRINAVMIDEHFHVGTLDPDEFLSRLTWSIAQLLQEKYPDVRLRERVRNDPLLEKTNLGDLLRDPSRHNAFMEELRRLPQCGTTQLTQLRMVLAQEQQAAEALGACQPMRMAVVSVPPSTLAADLASHTARCIFYPDFVDAVEDVYFRMWRLAQFDPFVYMPKSLPEFVKTPEVLAVEIQSGRDLTAYVQRIARLRNTLERIGCASGVVLLDSRALEEIFLRKRRYAALSQGTLERQFQILQELPSKLPTGVTCRVCDFGVTGLSSGTFVGSQAVLSIMGGYLVIDDAEFVASVQPRFDFAVEHGCPLPEFLEENS